VFDLSPEKILVLAVVAMIFLGPERIPKAARTVGRLLHQVRAQTGSFQAELNDVLAEPRKAINDAVGDLGLPTGLGGLPQVPSARSLLSQALTPPVAASSRDAASAGGDGAVLTPSGALPDDPSLN
jgi:Tat protein translocase TatB subunit